MLSNELIIKFTEVLDELVSGYEMCCGEFTEEQEDIMVEFLQTLKKIMEENDKKNV